MTNDNELGYLKPPIDKPFKKGQSGNPRGRPKGSKNARTIVNETLNRTVTIKENGRTRRVKFLEAFVHQLAAKALNGSTHDQSALFKLIHEYASEFLEESDLPRLITVKYVLPDGKTMDSYAENTPYSDTLDNDPKASPAKKQPVLAEMKITAGLIDWLRTGPRFDRNSVVKEASLADIGRDGSGTTIIESWRTAYLRPRPRCWRTPPRRRSAGSRLGFRNRNSSIRATSAGSSHSAFSPLTSSRPFSTAASPWN